MSVQSSGLLMPLSIATLVIALIAAAGMTYNFQTDIKEHSHPQFEPEPHTPEYSDAWIFEEFIKISDYHNDLSETMIDLRTDVAILKARGDVTTQPTGSTTTPSGTINLELRTQDNKGQIKSNFSRDTPVILITGKSVYEKNDFSITIMNPSGNFVKDRIVITYSNGDLSEAWIVPDNAEIGTYKVTISIKGLRDTISFNLT